MRFVKVNPFAPTVNNLLDGFFQDFAYKADFAYPHHAVNIIEKTDSYRIEVAAPGIPKEDFKLTLEKGHLNLSVESKNENATEEGQYKRREFNFAAFKKSFKLPENVQTAHIKAAHNNGILTVTLPKTEVQHTLQTIEIQ